MYKKLVVGFGLLLGSASYGHEDHEDKKTLNYQLVQTDVSWDLFRYENGEAICYGYYWGGLSCDFKIELRKARGGTLSFDQTSVGFDIYRSENKEVVCYGYYGNGLNCSKKK